jgi:hypothetical protein
MQQEDAVRKTAIAIIAISAIGITAGEAWAKPIKIAISVSEAKKICDSDPTGMYKGATNCFVACGSTVCDTECKYDKQTKKSYGCTVTVSITAPKGKKVNAPPPASILESSDPGSAPSGGGPAPTGAVRGNTGAPSPGAGAIR